MCLGGPGLARHDERRFALRVLDNVFGGTSSSRLFQEVRERRGLAYAVYSFTSAYQDTGQVGLYIGTRPDNVAEGLAVVGAELARMREQPATPDELERAKENLKGRVVLALESTGARMNRLGSEILAGMPLLSLDETVERIDAVTLEDLAGLVDELWAPERLSAAGIGPDEARFEEALSAVGPALVETALDVAIRVAVAGAAGRMGQTVCRPVDAAPDMELTGRADPALNTPLADVLKDADVLVDFTIPTSAVANAREAVGAGVHVVIGTTGFDPTELDDLKNAKGNVFIAPNFAIGAVLMMQFATQAARHMAQGRDHRAPSRPQGRRAERHRGADRGPDGARPRAQGSLSRSIRSVCPGSSPTRRSSSATSARR